MEITSVVDTLLGTLARADAVKTGGNTDYILEKGEPDTLTFRVSLTPSTSGTKYLNQKEDLSASGYTNGAPVSDKGDTDLIVKATFLPVGGEWVLVDKSGLLTRWAITFSLVIMAAATFVSVRRLRRRLNEPSTDRESEPQTEDSS